MANGRAAEDRPVSRRAELERELHDVELEVEAARRAVERAEAERVAVVQRNRERMVADADRLVQDRRAATTELVDELRRARDALIEAADLERWAHRFPEQDVRVPWHLLALDSKRAHVALGLTASTNIGKLLDALDADIAAVATAASAGTVQTVDPTAARWTAEVDQSSVSPSSNGSRTPRREYGITREALTEAQFDAYVRALQRGEV